MAIIPMVVNAETVNDSGNEWSTRVEYLNRNRKLMQEIKRIMIEFLYRMRNFIKTRHRDYYSLKNRDKILNEEIWVRGTGRNV
ncbi:MAG: hypothetical protein LWX56_10200 [Ignavibacteria bacterium]|nr:hypothetical protein [Ignavibacteria bacterium]